MSVKIDKILNLDDGEHRYTFDVKAGEIGLVSKDFEGRDHFEAPIHADVVLIKTNHLYHVKLKIATMARFLCDRCLEEAELAISDDIDLIYTDHRNERDGGDSSEIRLIDIRKENHIRLDKDVTDTLELAIPTKILCRESCRGLCTVCGTNLNEKTCEHAAIYDDARLN